MPTVCASASRCGVILSSSSARLKAATGSAGASSTAFFSCSSASNALPLRASARPKASRSCTSLGVSAIAFSYHGIDSAMRPLLASTSASTAMVCTSSGCDAMRVSSRLTSAPGVILAGASVELLGLEEPPPRLARMPATVPNARKRMTITASAVEARDVERCLRPPRRFITAQSVLRSSRSAAPNARRTSRSSINPSASTTSR